MMNFTGTARAQVFQPLPDGHPCYALVGMIAAEAARIERLLDQSICYIAKLDLRTGASLTGQMIGPAPRFNALLQLATDRGMSAEIGKKIKSVSGHAGGYFEKRNRAVHDPWLEDTGTGATHQYRAKSKTNPAFGLTPVSEQELKDTLKELRKHRAEVSELVSDIWTELQPPSP